MPCPSFSLSSVLKRRTLHSALAVGSGLSRPRAYHKRAPAPQQIPLQLPLRYVEREGGTPEEAERRQRAIERLDNVIDPNDLSATLEAHRDSNRASVIRTVPSKLDLDDSVLRPAFLETREIERPEIHQEATARTSRSSRAPHAESRQETRNAIKVSLKRLQTAHDMLSDRFGMKASASVEEGTLVRRVHKRGRKESQSKAEKAKMQNIDSMNGQPNEENRRAFLRENERPLEELSRARNRTVYFDSMRRTRRLILLKQASLKTIGRLRGVPDDILEYEGRYLRPQQSNMDFIIMEPWHRKLEDGSDLRQWFEQQIHLFAKWMEPTPAEEAARASVYQQIRSLVDQVAPTTRMEKYGSQTTGLALPMSDIDIRLFPKNFILELRRNSDQNTPWAKEFMRSMYDILNVLRDHPDFNPVVMHHARYPLIGATHIKTGLLVQLVASPDTSPSRDKIREYLAEWPTLKPLYMVIKTIFEMRQLSDVWQGGLGSYTIFMMVAASLKLHNRPTDSISKHLEDFLKFFGELDTYTHGVALEPPTLFKKKSTPSVTELEDAKENIILDGQNFIQKPFFYQQYLLCLQDPANPYNDLGKKGFVIKHVQQTFRTLHRDLEIRFGREGYPTKPERMLRKIVGRCDQVYEESRTKLDLFGYDVLGSEGDK
ncbi:hypothetical protein BDV97DRAFT_386389 [Delphinella strobiligena]|nr:hypothetical protein BDV97DRAFT_386389 [Delphinella strobiligena]